MRKPATDLDLLCPCQSTSQNLVGRERRRTTGEEYRRWRTEEGQVHAIKGAMLALSGGDRRAGERRGFGG